MGNTIHPIPKTMENIKSFIQECKQCWRQDIWLKILTLTSVGLVIASFIVPPLGIIDGSVLAAVGELTGIGALLEFSKAINKNINARVKVRELELEINRKRKDGMEMVHDEGNDEIADC